MAKLVTQWGKPDPSVQFDRLTWTELNQATLASLAPLAPLASLRF